MHFLEKSYLRLPKYTGGTAVMIKKSIKYHQLNNYNQDVLQAASVSVEDSVGLLTISAVYLSNKYTVKQEQFQDSYNTLGRKFIAGGHYNVKHTDWGFRPITSRGCEVLKTMEINILKHLSTGEPTYWSPDRNKLPDIVLMCYKGNSPKLPLSKIMF
jgi:hypothetical protein